MPPKPSAVWLSVVFAFVLAVIVWGANLWIYAQGGPSDSGIMVYVCFLPMAFFYTAAYQQAMTNHVKTLEERIKVLEAGKLDQTDRDLT